MTKQLKLLVFLLATSVACLAQTSGSTQSNAAGSTTMAGQTASAASQTTVQAVLTKSIDAKKAKQGDKVEAKTLQDATLAGTALPKGTKLIGHVTDAKARAKDGGDSTLAIAFDNAVLKNGQSVPFHAAIVAAAAPVMSAPMPENSMETSGPAAPMGANAPSAGGPLGGVGNAAGGAVGAAGQTVGGVTRDAGN